MPTRIAVTRSQHLYVSDRCCKPASEQLRTSLCRPKNARVRRQQSQDPFRGHIWKDKLEAVSRSWAAILLLVGLSVTFVLLGMFVMRGLNMPAKQEVATVVRFGSYATDVGDRPLVIVRLRNGTIRQLSIERAQLQSCRVGNQIRLVQQADWLRVHYQACLSG